MSDEKAPQVIADQEWFKSSHSAGDGGQCVEVAVTPGIVHVRDSKDQAGPVLSVADAEWAAFTRFAASL